MIRVSAPGKAILMGEHAAVYGRPALVAALDRRVRVQFDPAPTHLADQPAGTVDLELPQLAVHRREHWLDLQRQADAARKAWQGVWHQRTGARRKGVWHRPEVPEDRSHLVRIALGEALAALDDAARREVVQTSVAVRITSEFPVGSGFGSSAAIAVAVVRAVFALADREMDEPTLHSVSLEVERRQHGSPSGVDNATVVRGGVLWVVRDANDRLVTERLDDSALASPVLAQLRVYQTGEPAESTGEVVAAVGELRGRDVPSFERRLQVMEDAAVGMRDELLGEGRLESAMKWLRRFEGCLESLGVVPKPVQQTIRSIEAAGGAAKISGAGSLAGPGAGSLLVLHPEPEVLDDLGVFEGYERLEVKLGGPGVHLD